MTQDLEKMGREIALKCVHTNKRGAGDLCWHCCIDVAQAVQRDTARRCAEIVDSWYGSGDLNSKITARHVAIEIRKEFEIS